MVFCSICFFFGDLLYKIYYVLTVCYPGVLVLLLCTIVVWSLVVITIYIGTSFDGLCAPFAFFGVGFVTCYGLDY